MLEFYIYELKSRKIPTWEISILGVVLVVLHLLFPYIEISVLLILFLIFAAVFIAQAENNKPIGKIYFSSHKIKVSTNTIEFQESIHNLDKLELVYGGHSEKILKGNYVGPLTQFSGTDNYFYLSKKNNEFKCRILVENENREKELIELVKTWEAIGYDISQIVNLI